jgi:hypothetical protein
MSKLNLFFGAILALIATAACTSLNARLANKVGCEEKEATVENQVTAPGYSRYHVTCKGKVYVCQMTPFTQTCHEDDGKDDSKK